MKKIAFAVLMAALLTACGKGQNGDPKPDNYIGKHGTHSIKLKNGQYITVQKAQGVVTSVNEVGKSYLGGYSNKHSYAFAQAVNNNLIPMYGGDDTEESYIKHLTDLGYRATYSGSAYAYNESGKTSSASSESKENSSNASVNSALNAGVLNGESRFIVDFGKKLVTGNTRIQGAKWSESSGGSTTTDKQGNMTTTPGESKSYIREMYTDVSGTISGNKVSGIAHVSPMSEGKSELSTDGVFKGKTTKVTPANSNARFEGSFYGPNADEFAGDIKHNSNSTYNVVFNADKNP